MHLLCCAGWQHLFLAEGVATLVLAIILRWRLPGSVLTSNFLDSEDKLWLMQQLQPSTAAASDPVDVVVPDSKTQSGSQLAADAGSVSGSGGLQQQQHRQQQQEGADADAQEVPQAAPMLLPPVQEQQQQQLHVIEKQLSAGQQLLLTIRNRWIWYLMLLKALKVHTGRVLSDLNSIAGTAVLKCTHAASSFRILLKRIMVPCLRCACGLLRAFCRI